jgi:hypothetical protein
MKTRENAKKKVDSNTALWGTMRSLTRLTFTALLVTGVSIMYESRQHRSEHVLPPNVENFLVELFQEPSRFNPSDEPEKLQADKTQQLDLFDPDDDGQDGDDNMRHQNN